MGERYYLSVLRAYLHCSHSPTNFKPSALVFILYPQPFEEIRDQTVFIVSMVSIPEEIADEYSLSDLFVCAGDEWLAVYPLQDEMIYDPVSRSYTGYYLSIWEPESEGVQNLLLEAVFVSSQPNTPPVLSADFKIVSISVLLTCPSPKCYCGTIPPCLEFCFIKQGPCDGECWGYCFGVPPDDGGAPPSDDGGSESDGGSDDGRPDDGGTESPNGGCEGISYYLPTPIISGRIVQPSEKEIIVGVGDTLSLIAEGSPNPDKDKRISRSYNPEAQSCSSSESEITGPNLSFIWRLWKDNNGLILVGVIGYGQQIQWQVPSEVGTYWIELVVDDDPNPDYDAPGEKKECKKCSQVSNTDDPAARDWLKVIVVQGYIRLLSSSPHHIVYRRPPEPLGEPNDDELVIGPESQNTDDFDPGDEVDVGDDEDFGAYEDLGPDEWDEPSEDFSEPPAVIDPEPNEELDHPTIQFTVSVRGYPYWKAQIVIYPIGQTTPIAIYTTEYPSSQTSVSVSWDDIFPTEKPPTGVYTYDIIVEGCFVIPPSPAYLNSRGTGKDKRLSEKAKIQNLQIIPSLDISTASIHFSVRFQVTGAEKVLSARAEFRNFRGEEIGRIELQQQSGWWQGQWSMMVDSTSKLGNLQVIVCADVEESGKKKVVREAFTPFPISIRVTGVALGFEVWNQNQPILTEQERRRPYAGYTAIFRAFVRLNWCVGDTIRQQWYSDTSLNLQDLVRYSWITPLSLTGEFAGRPQSNVLQFPEHLRQLLDLQVTWRKFINFLADRQVCRRNNGIGMERWYGMRIDQNQNGISFQWTILHGTHWWGASVRWYHYQNETNGNTRIVRHRMVFLYPTDRANGIHLIRLGEGQVEYHNGIRRSGEARFNWARIGPNGRTQVRLWRPNPWEGRISAMLRQPVVTFAGQDTPQNEDDDPFFANEQDPIAAMQRQGEFNRRVLELAYSFVDVPYSWGGTSYGGNQSVDSGQFTCSNTRHGTYGLGIPDSGRRFGIDCSGLVWRVANELGVRWTRMSSTGLAQTPIARDMPANPPGDRNAIFEWRYVRPGDFACYLTDDGVKFPVSQRLCSHVVYVRETPTEFRGRIPVILETIEADGRNHKVLPRQRTFEELERYIPRRWIAP